MNIDFNKMNGLVPAIIQDNITRKVLMLGFMNKEAYEKTIETGRLLSSAAPKTVCGPKEKKVVIFFTLYL